MRHLSRNNIRIQHRFDTAINETAGHSSYGISIVTHNRFFPFSDIMLYHYYNETDAIHIFFILYHYTAMYKFKF